MCVCVQVPTGRAREGQAPRVNGVQQPEEIMHVSLRAKCCQEYPDAWVCTVPGTATKLRLMNASCWFTVYYALCHLPVISQGICHSIVSCCCLLTPAAWTEESGQCREYQAALCWGSNALPHGSTPLDKDVWKLFWYWAQDLCLLPFF